VKTYEHLLTLKYQSFITALEAWKRYAFFEKRVPIQTKILKRKRVAKAIESTPLRKLRTSPA